MKALPARKNTKNNISKKTQHHIKETASQWGPHMLQLPDFTVSSVSVTGRRIAEPGRGARNARKGKGFVSIVFPIWCWSMIESDWRVQASFFKQSNLRSFGTLIRSLRCPCPDFVFVEPGAVGSKEVWPQPTQRRIMSFCYSQID